MTTATLYRTPRPGPCISFELYPPRTPRGEETIGRTIGALADLAPDYFSITYGASGSTRATSRELICRVRDETRITPLAHLTCVGASAEDLDGYVATLLQAGVRDFLALRGDAPAGEPDWRPHPEGLTRASELVALLRQTARDHLGEEGDAVSISVATYPGGAYDAQGRPRIEDDDVAALLEKQAAGADFAITQLFYDAGHYAELVRAARAAGVRIPIVPGLIPLTDPRRLRRMVELTGVPVPPALLEELDSAPDKEEAYRRGLAASVRLVHEVLETGAPGIHFYTFNSSRAVLDLLRESGLRPT
ncbi:methylenetetrahydrofolate reductase [Ruania suaedae]|uniref:methylenetetrahydrofolate reductase n=1 Tax=Ruania suaedae TaxID=2897774 RepID=UPI001E560EF7|nr:methylenetetrahydrofolate reductase [Ruania suaedae]UFU03272.1 methylenetetrahydrofolate reductase [Ruania suaedae]